MAAPKTLMIVDVETTDLPSNDPDAQIVEIAAAILDCQSGVIAYRYSDLVRFSRPVCDFTAKHFAGVDFSGALDIVPALEKLFTLWRGFQATFAGWNPMFDLTMIRKEAEDYGIAIPKPPEVDYHVVDISSMTLPYVLRGEIEGMSLRHGRLWAGQKGEQNHRAMGDVLDAAQVFREVMMRTKGLDPGLGTVPHIGY